MWQMRWHIEEWISNKEYRTDLEALQVECRKLIDAHFSKGILDLQLLHDKWNGRWGEGLLPIQRQGMTLKMDMRESKLIVIGTAA